MKFYQLMGVLFVSSSFIIACNQGDDIQVSDTLSDNSNNQQSTTQPMVAPVKCEGTRKAFVVYTSTYGCNGTEGDQTVIATNPVTGVKHIKENDSSKYPGECHWGYKGVAEIDLLSGTEFLGTELNISPGSANNPTEKLQFVLQQGSNTNRSPILSNTMSDKITYQTEVVDTWVVDDVTGAPCEDQKKP